MRRNVDCNGAIDAKVLATGLAALKRAILIKQSQIARKSKQPQPSTQGTHWVKKTEQPRSCLWRLTSETFLCSQSCLSLLKYCSSRSVTCHSKNNDYIAVIMSKLNKALPLSYSRVALLYIARDFVCLFVCFCLFLFLFLLLLLLLLLFFQGADPPAQNPYSR